MYIHMHVRMYVRTYACTHVCTYICMYACMYVHMHIRMCDFSKTECRSRKGTKLSIVLPVDGRYRFPTGQKKTFIFFKSDLNMLLKLVWHSKPLVLLIDLYAECTYVSKDVLTWQNIFVSYDIFRLRTTPSKNKNKKTKTFPSTLKKRSDI
jgi:hypothetical protein